MIEESIPNQIKSSDDIVDSNTRKYKTLISELDEMIKTEGRGYNTAAEINDKFWEYLDMHKGQLEEQVNHLNNPKSEKFEESLKNSETIYEAAREWKMKYDK